MMRRLKSTDRPIPSAITRLRAKIESGTTTERETHDAEGDGNGEHGSDQRHCCGPQTAEHEEQQQQEQRESEEFRPSEVLRGDGCDLDAGHGGAAEPGIALQ